MSYKTERGNVAKKCLRFHAAVKMVFDYQLVTKYTVAASRRTFNFCFRRVLVLTCPDMDRRSLG